jgi:hypothetical protein
MLVLKIIQVSIVIDAKWENEISTIALIKFLISVMFLISGEY